MNDPLSSEDIDTLVARVEDAKVERKKELYCSRSKGEEAEFVKDILSLVNAHGDGPAFMPIGIEDTGDIPHDITALGLREQNLQQLLRERIEPTVRFSFREYTYQGVKIGIIQIPRSCTRFHLTSRSISNESQRVILEEGQIYIRDGTSKRVVNSSDFTLLRNEIEERSRLDEMRQLEQDRPDISVSFPDGSSQFTIQSYWDGTEWPKLNPPSHIKKEVSVPVIVRNTGRSYAKNVG